MNKDKYSQLDKQLIEYRKQQINQNKNRQSLFNDYDRSTILTNSADAGALESFNDQSEGFFTSAWNSTKQNISDLWNSINYDMDVQDVNAKIGDVSDAKTYHDDMIKIKDYYDLLKRKESLEDQIYNDPNMSTRTREDLDVLIEQLDNVKESIAQLDSYFTGEGRTHDAIAQNMYDGTKLSMLERFNAQTAQAIKNGWSNHNVRLGLSKYGVLGSIAGGVIEGLSDIVTRPVGVLDEILSGAYGEAKDIVKSMMSDEYSTSSRMQNYIKYLSKDNDEVLNKAYVGGDLINRDDILKDIDSKTSNAKHEYNEAVENLKESQDNLKYGRLFGIDGAYDYNSVSNEWKKQRQWYQQEGGFVDGLLHPFLATQDIASSLDMMKYQIGAQGVDVLIKRLTHAFLKGHPVVAGILSAADVATGVGATIKSREEETALEKIGALGNRVAKEAKDRGGNIESILQQIKQGGSAMGIDVDALTVDQLWQLGIALNIKTDDAAFEQAKQNAQHGINKLINANNALGILDYAQMLPYMSYSGDVTRNLKIFRNKALDNVYLGKETLGQRLNMRFDPNVYKYADYKRVIDQNLNTIDGYFSKKIKNAAKTFLKRDMPNIALKGKHFAEYEGRKLKTLLGTAASESVEEGVQNLLSTRYMRGDYDDYHKKQSMFDLSEFVLNPEIATTAIADYFGVGAWDPDNGSEDLIKSMNIGFWSSFIQSRGQHALTNLTGASDENIRGLARQFYDDNVAIRILAEQEKALQDNTHIDMFYDRFQHGADWSSLFTSLNDLKQILETDSGKKREGETEEQYQARLEQAKNTLVKKEYIDDDIKLMTATWGLYSNDEVSKELDKKDIKKDSETYRQFLRDGATALMDYHKTRELVLQQMKDINATQQYQEYILTKILDGSLSQDELSQLVKDNPKLAAAIEKFSNNYDKYIKDFPKYTDREFQSYVKSIKTVDEFIEVVGKETLQKNIDDDIKNSHTKKEGPKYKIQAQRLFEAKTKEAKQKRDELLKPIYEKDAEDLFRERMLNENSRGKNKSKKFSGHWAIRELVKDKALAFDEGITSYLDDVFENDTEERDRLIHEAYLRTRTPKTKALFALEQLRMLHNLKKRKAIEENLSWADDQAQALTNIRQMTGLDVDPSKIQGWVDNYKKKLEQLRAVEHDIVGKNSDFEKFLGGVYELDDDDTHNKTLQNYFVNRAMMDAQGRIANAYMSLSENPNVLRQAIFGESATGTYLDDIVNEYGAVVARKNSRRESDSRLGFDEVTDLEDMQHLSKKAAWEVIQKRIDDAIQRKKIVHRKFEEDAPQVQFLDSNKQEEESTEEEPIEYDGEVLDNPSNAEKAARAEFYHDNGKKQDVKAEIDKRREEAKQKEKEDKDDSEDALDDLFDEFESFDGEQKTSSGATKKSSPKNDTTTTSENDDGSEQKSTDKSGNDNTAGDGKEEGSSEPHAINKIDNSELDDEQIKPAAVDEDDINDDNIKNAVDELDAEDEEDADSFENDIQDDGATIDDDINDEGDVDAAFEDDIQRTDQEIAEDVMDDDIQEDFDPSFIGENEFGDVEYDGDPLDDDTQDEIREEFDLLDAAEDAPVHINDSTQVDNEEDLGDIIGEPSPDLIWQTLFYKYDEQDTPLILSVNGKPITEFNGKPLRTGGELSKKLVQKGWLHKVKSYYVVTQSLQAQNTKNNKDAFTIALILEDEDASYACVYKSIGDVISISSKYKGHDGKAKVYNIHQREILKASLLLHNMDIKKVLEYVGGISKPETDDNLRKRQIVAAYKQAINSYARELYAQDYAQLHRDNKNAKQKAYSKWDSIQKSPSESVEDFEARKKQWEENKDSYTYQARKYFSKPDRIIFKESKIDEEIDKLKKTRDEIIDAYLEKDKDKNYIFPDKPYINKVRPQHLEQSNGRVDSQKTKGGLPIYRTLTDPNASMEEIQDMLEDESLLIGIGSGLRARKTGKKYILKYGFTRNEDEAEVLFKKGGLSGKLYMMVHSLTGKKILPIMLAEEKFDVQHRQTSKGEIESVPINGSRKVKLCIDPITKQLIPGVKEKASAAEVLLYMILGELNLPGLQTDAKRDRTQYDENELVQLFINCSSKTLLDKQPDPNSDLMVNLASKQLYYGAKPVKVKKQTSTGKTITVWQPGTGDPMLFIGLPQEVEVEVPQANGTTVKKVKTTYIQQQFSKNQILESQDDTEDVRQQKRELRQTIVQAIATQMHWNTDDYTFGESASVDASKSILGELVQYLIQQDFENDVFDNMTPQQMMDHKVSIMGCPQLSFRIGDFYSVPEGGAEEFGDLTEQRGSVLAWMIKTGRIKTDTSKQVFTAPFIFAHGVKAKSNNPVQKTAEGLSIPIEETKRKKQKNTSNTEPKEKQSVQQNVESEDNVFYDESKERQHVSRIKVRGLDKLNIPKTIAEVKEKIKKWVEFLKSSGANNTNFANRIDIEKNDPLQMILLQNREKQDICEFSEQNDESGLGISEDDDEGLIEWDEKLREDQIDRFIEEYNKTHKDKLEKSSVEKGNLKKFNKRTADEVDAIFVYKEKETGKIKALVDTVDAYETEDATPEELPFNQRHYTISAATGVFSKRKTKGKFDEKKAREWLSDKLGIDPSNVVVWGAAEEALRDPEIMGAVDVIVDTITDSLVGVIGLRKTGGRSVHYHEAWHYVNLLLHNEEEREYLYKAYLNTHKGFAKKKPLNKEIEERMAEDFRKWVLLQEDTSIIGSIRRAFSDLFDFLRIFNKKREYRQVFDDIIAGNYKQGRASQADLAYFKKEWREGAPFVKYYIPGTTEEQRQKKFEHISNHQQYFDASVAIAKRIISDANVRTEKDIKRVNGSDYGDMLKSVEKWIDKSADLSTRQRQILRDVMQNPDLVKRAVQESFEELGLTAKIRTLKQVEKAEKGKLDDKDDKMNVVNESEMKENAPADNTWDRFDLAVSKKDNASIRTKLLMRQIPVLKRVYNDDGTFTYEEDVDSFGLVNTYSFKEAWNLIVDNLWQCESLCDKDKNGYKDTSLLGMIDRRRKSNDFYESLWRIFTNVEGNNWDAIVLRSQVYTTINANRPQVSYLRIQDPKEQADDDDFSGEDDSFDESEIIRNGAIADVRREWSIKNDNEEEISRNIPREWSKALTAHGLIEMNKQGDTVLSKKFAKSLSKRLSEVREKLSREYGKKELKENINDIVDDVIDFYNMLSVPLDRDSLMVMIQLSSRGSTNITNRDVLNKLKGWFLYEDKNAEDSEEGQQESVQNTLPKMADAIIAAANSGVSAVKYAGDERERQFDELLSNFREGTHIYKLAKAYNIVHPSAKEFSIKSPNNDRIYPISQNSFISDRIRQLSITNGEFAKSMMQASKYCAASQLLDISSKWAKQQKADTHFKLNAFVGIKDMNRPKGADYFGITPMEDYIAKLIMTEQNQLVLPTMADKKTWYSISHKNLKLCHDAMLVMPYKDTLEKHIYQQYEKENPKPDGELESKLLEWQVDAKAWYRSLDSNSEVKQKINEDATEEYKKSNRSVQIMHYSDDTLNQFGKYMLGEIDAVIQYYSRANVKKLIKNSARLIDNYHGKLYKTESGQTRLDFSGNGGRLRYFYDILTFTDKSGKRYNLNQRLQYLYELQKQIETGRAKNISQQDPLYKTIGSLALGDPSKLDGFELIREELKRIRDLHFKQGAFISQEIKTSINEMLIGATKQELDKLSDENSPYKMVSKRNGKYIPNGIPTQLILSYANKISKTLENKGTYFETTQGLDETVAQDALFSLIANYVANQAISVIEFEKVFSGDPAFYSIKNAETPKRVKDKSSLPKEGKSNVLYITEDDGVAYKWNGKSYIKQSTEDVTTMQQITERVTLANGQTAESSIYVDIVSDSFSDKIKRLGSTLSPGDEMRLSYTDEELQKYPDLAITNYTNMNVEDINAQSMFIDHVSSIFERQLLIDHIRAIDKSKLEEYCKNNNVNFEKTIAAIYEDDDVFKSVYNLYEDIKPKIKKELKSQLKPYNDITVCDAQVFVRPSLYRKIRIGLGQWSYDDERAYQIIQGVGEKFKEGSNTGDWLADEKLYNAVRKLELFPLKMSYFQNDPSNFLGSAIPGLNKMAVFPLFKFQATTDTSRKLYERMNLKGNELDMISFKSAVKVGAHQNGVKMSKDGVDVSEQVCTIDDLFNKSSAARIDYRVKNKDGEDNKDYGSVDRRYGDDFVPVQIQSLNNLRMQLNTEHHEEDFRNIGTQMFKLAFSNIIDDAEYDGKSGEFIKKDIMRIIKQLTSVGDEKLRKKYFQPSVDPENLIPNNEELRKYIKLIIQNNGLGVAAEDIFDDGGVAASIMSREVFENSVTSLVNSEVVDIEMPGGTAIQQSVFGFVGHGNNEVHSQVGAYKINYNNGEELNWDMENGSMEVILSINFFRSILPDEIKKKSFTEQKQWLINHDIIKGRKTGGASFTDEELSIKKTLDELLPEDRTQYKNWSDETFKYLDNIGISRKYGGTINSIITRIILQDVPENIKKELEQFLESKGVSFDTKYPKPTSKDGEMSNPKPFGMGYRIPTQGLSSMFAFTVADVMPPMVGDLIIVPREFTAQTGSDFDVDKLFLATYSYKNGQREAESGSGSTKGALTNQLLDYYITLITDIKNYANARASIDVLTSELKNDFVNGVIRNQPKKYLSGVFALTPSFQIDKKREFSIGKEGIAPFALNVTNLSLTQMCHLTMRYDGNISQYGFGALDQIYGRDGRRIADWLSAMVNAHVDVAKDPYIFDLNVNHATYNYANFLLRAGMGMSTFTFLAQQSLKNIADEINNAGGIYGGNIDGSTPESEIYKRRRNQCIQHEYRSIRNKLKGIQDRLVKADGSVLSKEEQGRLNNLIAYADYKCKNHYNKKGQEKEKEPSFDYDRSKVFDEQTGKDQIQKGRSSDDVELIDYYEHQLACVRCFQEISEHAQAISSLVSASQIDTKKFGNTIKQMIDFRNKMDHIREDGAIWTINDPSFDQQFLDEKGKVDKKAAQREAIRRYFEDSYLDDKFTKATSLIKNMLKTQLFTATNAFENTFRWIFSHINGGDPELYEREYSADKVDAIGSAIDSIMRFNAMFNAGTMTLSELPEGAIDLTLGGNKKAVVENWKRILYGNDKTPPLYRRIAELQANLKNNKKKWDYFDLIDQKTGKVYNELLDILVPQSPNQKSSIGKITLITSLIDKDSQYKRKLISSFAQLLNSKSEGVRDIAVDLVFYAYYSAYDQNTVNSFFELVPPEYRKQYDLALSKTLALLNSSNEDDAKTALNIIYDGAGKSKIIDVISRNYWYDDNIVPRYYPGNYSAKYPFTSNGAVYGSSMVYGREFGFPQYVAMDSNDNTVKHNDFFKIKIRRETLLYRKIGTTQAVSVADGKPAKRMSIYVPIPKAGLHQNGTHQFEFYADYETPSVFEDNRISTNFSHQAVRKAVEDLISEINSKEGRMFDVNVTWQDQEIPEAYDIFNRSTYTKLDPSQFEEIINKMHIHPARETSGGIFKDPEKEGVNSANVVIELNATGVTSFKSYEEDKKAGISEDNLKKVVALNIDKQPSKSDCDKIKKLLFDDTFVRRVYVKVSDKHDVQITQEDKDEYLSVIGADSPTAKRLLKDNKLIESAVKQYKINKYLLSLMNRIRKGKSDDIYLDTSYYGNTTSAEAVQFVKLFSDSSISANVGLSNYAQFKNPRLFDNLKYALNHRKEDYSIQTVESAEELVEQVLKDHQNDLDKASEIIENTNDDAFSDDIEGYTMDLGDFDTEEKPSEQPAIFKQIDQTNRQSAQNQECNDSVNAAFDEFDAFD